MIDRSQKWSPSAWQLSGTQEFQDNVVALNQASHPTYTVGVRDETKEIHPMHNAFQVYHRYFFRKS
jgi:hypothetical protein